MSSSSIHIQLINQVFELEKKISENAELQKLERNVKRMRSSLEELGFFYHNPMGENYNESRTDCDASIAGNSVENLKITDVIKPIIRSKESGLIIQKAVVIVEAK